jgi:hypothetical protein
VLIGETKTRGGVRERAMGPRATLQPRLFEDLPVPEPTDCSQGHADEKTETIWPGETWVRWTWTCRRCGRVMGRVRG